MTQDCANILNKEAIDILNRLIAAIKQNEVKLNSCVDRGKQGMAADHGRPPYYEREIVLSYTMPKYDSFD